MSLINVIGNSISKVASDVANGITIVIAAIVDVIISTGDNISGLFSRFYWRGLV